MADDILIAPAASTAFVTVKITGFKNVSSAASFQEGLRRLPGVTQAQRQRYHDGALELSVYLKAEYRDRLAEGIETCSTGRKLGVIVDAWSKARIDGRVTRPNGQVRG